MLFIHDEIIPIRLLNRFLNINSTKYKTARDVISFIISNNSNKYFYDISKKEYDYKITISSKEQLEEFMNFFKKYPLTDNEYICFKRYGINLKETYEVINKFNKYPFTHNIYVEQFDKNEWISYDDYSVIYDFLKSFERTLPKQPTTMDIIINAYDYVKSREYLAEKDKKSLISKKFSTSILSPYIVCAGFVKQFNCILKEYNIPCFEYQFMNKNNIGHDVSLVYVEGYGIYFFDITRDSYTRKDQSETLKNEAKYSGFMLPYTYYLDNKISNDNFDKELLKNPKIMEIKKKYAKQQITYGNDKTVDIFNEQEFNKTYLLQTLVDVDFELLKSENLFIEVSNNKEMMTEQIYNALLKINQHFGTEITDIDIFLDMLISSKKNSELKNNTLYYKKAIISRYSDNNEINLSEAMNIITKKLTK